MLNALQTMQLLTYSVRKVRLILLRISVIIIGRML
nr:MAG TPA: hypothetical protein [Crassvirales sp.]